MTVLNKAAYEQILSKTYQLLNTIEGFKNDDDYEKFKKTKEYIDWAYEYEELHGINVTLEFLHSDEEMYEAFLKLNYGYMTYRNNNNAKLSNKSAALQQALERAESNGYKPIDSNTTPRQIPQFAKKEYSVPQSYEESKKNIIRETNTSSGSQVAKLKELLWRVRNGA